MSSLNDNINLEENPKLEAKLEKYGLLPKEPVITKEEVRELIQKVDKKIEEKKKRALNLPNPATGEMLNNLADIAILGLTSISAYISKNGIGVLPHREEKEIEWANQFSFEVVLQLIVGTDFLTTFFKSVARNCDTTEENREKIAETLKLLALLFALYGGADGNEERFKKLVKGVADPVRKGIQAVEGIVKDERLSLHMKQANLALENEEMDQFILACKGALEVLEITPEKMQKDLKEIKNLGNTIADAIANSGDEPTTTVAHAM